MRLKSERTLPRPNTELHALQAIKIFFKDFRAYLKTVNMPKQRVFSACCAPFSLASVDKGIHNKTTKYGLPTY